MTLKLDINPHNSFKKSYHETTKDLTQIDEFRTSEKYHIDRVISKVASIQVFLILKNIKIYLLNYVLNILPYIKYISSTKTLPSKC